MNNLVKKVMRKIAIWVLIKKGYSPYTASVAIKEFEDDFFINEGLTIKQKLSAYKKGHYSKRIISYNLDNDLKYEQYIPELRYYKLHPINGKYSKWIDDKLTFRYILSPFNAHLPEYYYQISRQKIMKLCDCPSQYGNTVSDIFQLLRDTGDLAVKQVNGSRGDGFYKFSYNNKKYYINDKEVSERRVEEIISSLDNYVFTDYIVTHEQLRKIFPSSTNSIRVMFINDDYGPQITGAMIRFGTEKSGIVDNVSAGGIFCGVNIDTGELFNPYQYDQHKNLVPIHEHPNTGVKIEGVIPHWDSIKNKLIEIGNYLPQLKYLGFDIVPTEDSFKIIEINSLQGLHEMQLYYPVMKNIYSKAFFSKLLAK